MMTINRGTWLIVNGASGSNGEDSVASLAGALAAAGRRPDRVIDLRTASLPSPADLDAAGVGLLVIFTGDGSANSAIVGVEGWGGEVLLLPGGTANLLSRALHGDAADSDGIVAALGAGRLAPVKRDCITFSGGKALIEVLAGPGATWSDVREELREGDIAAVAGTAIDAAVQSAAGPMVKVVDPPLGRDEGYAGVRLEPRASSLMTVSGYGAQGVTDYVKQGIALLRRDFREGPHDDLGLHAGVTCRSVDGSPIELMIDGERVTGAAQERFSLAPLAVNLLAVIHG